MAKKAKSFIALAALLLIAGCAKQAEPQANDTKSTGPSADMLLSDDGGVDDKRLAEAQHINMAIDKNGMVIFQVSFTVLGNYGAATEIIIPATATPITPDIKRKGAGCTRP